MLNSDKDLFEFLSNAPKDFREGERIKKYQLKNGDFIHCVLWNMHFYITGTDIVKILIWRFQNAGRTLNSLKKFEEGIFSDLRNLKPGIDATLEGPRSEFLEFLYKNGCIRTQKKQKVFYWYSVPHDALFCDALERDLRRETNLYTYNKYMNNLTRHNTMGGFGVAHTRLNMKRLSSEYDHRFSRSMDSLNSRGNTPQFNRNKLPNMLDSQISMRKPEIQRNRIQQDGIMKNPMFNSSVPSAFSVKDKLFLQQSSAPKVYPEYDIFEEDMFFRDDKKRNDVFVKNDDKQINPSAIDKSIPENFSMDDFDFLRVRVEERMRKEEKNKKSEEKKVINSNNKQDNNLGDYKDFHSF